MHSFYDFVDKHNAAVGSVIWLFFLRLASCVISAIFARVERCRLLLRAADVCRV